jgi:hypothetical protein
MRWFFLVTILLVVVGLASAECEFTIDDFELGLGDWSITSGSVSIGEEGINHFLIADVTGGGDLFKNNINLDLDNLSGYNLTFRYRFVEEQSESGGRYVGISNLPNDFDCDSNPSCWSAYMSDYDAFDNDETVGVWYTYNKAVDSFTNDGGASDGVGSLTLEPAGKVEIDDVKLIKSKYYECSDWGLCFLGMQTRQCTETESCSAARPSEQRQCMSWEPLTLLGVVLIVISLIKLYKPKPKKVKVKTRKKKR